MQIKINPALEKPLKESAAAANTTPTRHANLILTNGLKLPKKPKSK